MNFALGHELIHWLNKQTRGWKYYGVLKVDLNKAYNRLRQYFVLAILQVVCLTCKWIDWFYQSISTVSFSILVNGDSPHPSRCMLVSARETHYPPSYSSYALRCLFVASTKLNLRPGNQASRRALKITHLFFLRMTPYSFSQATP